MQHSSCCLTVVVNLTFNKMPFLYNERVSTMYHPTCSLISLSLGCEDLYLAGLTQVIAVTDIELSSLDTLHKQTRA
jgi:hypothetical protein